MSRLVRTLIVVLTSVVCIGCDRLTKAAAVESLKGAEPIQLAGGLVRLEYAENQGAFLGLGRNLDPSARFWLLGVGTAAILLAIAASLFWRGTRSAWSLFALALVLAGGLGNLIDRLADGFVVDFLNLGVGGVRTGIFNVADMAITFGVLALTLPALFRRRAEHATPTGPPGSG